jgi:hypothetical protein
VEARIEDRSTQGVVVMGIQVRCPDERRTVNSARVLRRRNGAAADQKTASDFIRPSAGRGKCPPPDRHLQRRLRDGSADSAPDQAAGTVEEGFVLERQHTLSSTLIGHDSNGNPQFDTKRNELGELVYRLKNRSDRKALTPIAEAAVNSSRAGHPKVDAIVPVRLPLESGRISSRRNRKGDRDVAVCSR